MEKKEVNQMNTTKGRYTHALTLSAEQEARLNAQRKKGRTIIGLLILGLQEAEKAK